MSPRGIMDEDPIEGTEDDDEDFEVDLSGSEQAFKCLDCGEEGSGRVARVQGHLLTLCSFCDSENVIAVD